MKSHVQSLIIVIIMFMMPLCASFYETVPVSMKQRSISQFLEENTDAKCILCTQKYPFNFTTFPLYSELSNNYFPASGYFKPMYIVSVPHGTALFIKHNYSTLNYVFINNCFIVETQIKWFNWFGGNEFKMNGIPDHIQKIPGRVVIISHHFPECYGHWIFDVLGQLALLEIYNVEYDYLCIPYDAKFMKETLQIWGIDSSKIIPLTQPTYIQAETIIMATPVTQIEVLVGQNVNYNADFILQHIRNKILKGLNAVENPISPKVFVSRMAALSRVISNEDEVFALFQQRGFKRYELTELSIVEQILLFRNAASIVSFVGSGSTNIMFCNPGTQYIEILQSAVDATFFYVSDMFKLQYNYINDSSMYNLLTTGHSPPASIFPLGIIADFLEQHPDL